MPTALTRAERAPILSHKKMGYLVNLVSTTKPSKTKGAQLMIPDSAPFGRSLFRQVQPLIEEATREHKADRYRKKFRATSHIWLLVMHMASGSGSLRQTH